MTPTMLRPFLALAPLIALALPAHGGDREARVWLERMSETLANRNYEGRFFHLRGSRSETLRIIHRVDKGKVSERLVSLDGSGREIIRNEAEVICYLPDKRTVLVEKRADDSSLITTVPSYNERLEEHYSIERGPATKAFGRKTQVILVQPRDQFRYGYRLWLDSETAMPLQSQLCDRNGNVIEQILFAEINFRERISAESMKPAVSAEGFAWLRQDTQRTAASIQPGWNVIRLPPGFRLTTWRLQQMAGTKQTVRHLVYSDGLASVSLFIEPRSPQAEPMNGLTKVGAAFVFSRNLDDVQLVVVGEVPPKTLEAIAEGVTRESVKGGPAAASAREVAAPPARPAPPDR